MRFPGEHDALELRVGQKTVGTTRSGTLRDETMYANPTDHSPSSMPTTTSIACLHSRLIIVRTSSLNSPFLENHDLFMSNMSTT